MTWLRKWWRPTSLLLGIGMLLGFEDASYDWIRGVLSVNLLYWVFLWGRGYVRGIP